MAEIVATMDLLDHAGWVQPHPERPRGQQILHCTPLPGVRP